MKNKILLVSLVFAALGVGQKVNADKNYTKEEVQRIQTIQEKYRDIEDETKTLNYSSYFSELPIIGTNNKYTTGKFTDKTKELMKDQLNYYRYLSELDPLEINEEMMIRAQSGAVGMAAVDKQTHNLYLEKKLNGMTDEFWEDAKFGVTSSEYNRNQYYSGNISSYYTNKELFSAIHGYLYDFGETNKLVLHRQSLLGMRADGLSFGYAERPKGLTRGTIGITGTIYKGQSDIDHKRDTVVTWPPKGVAPTNVFYQKGVNEHFRWSINLFGGKEWMNGSNWMGFVKYGYQVDENTKVFLTNETTGETTEFKSNSEENKLYWSNNADSYLIFQPKIKDYKSGDTYKVKVTNLTFNEKEIDYEYQVKLFDINEKVSDANGIFGTSPWTWDEKTQTLTFETGKFPNTNDRNDNIFGKIEKNEIPNRKKIKKIIFNDKVELSEKSSSLFEDLEELEKIENIKYLDTSNVVDMSAMFNDLKSLNQLDLSNLNTSKVTTMTGMFSSSQIKKLNLNNWDTSNVKDMSNMFRGAPRTSFGPTRIEELNISKWDTSKVTDMSSMFSGMEDLKTIDISNWNTSKVTNMSAMFSENRDLNELQINNWDTSKVRTIAWMFRGMDNIEELNLSNWNTSMVRDIYNTFLDMKKLEKLNISNWSIEELYWNNNSLYDYYLVLGNTPSLETFIINKDTRILEYFRLDKLYEWTNGESVYVSEDFNHREKTKEKIPGEYKRVKSRHVTGKYGSTPWSFDKENQVLTFGAGMFPESKYLWDNNLEYKIQKNRLLENIKIKKIVFTDKIVLDEKSTLIFGRLSELESIENINYLDASRVKEMNSMFSDTNLKELDLSSWNTPSLESVYNMFGDMKNLEKIKLFDWSKSSYQDEISMYGLFNNKPSLEYLSIPTSMKVTKHMDGINSKIWVNENTKEEIRFDFTDSSEEIELPSGDYRVKQ